MSRIQRDRGKDSSFIVIGYIQLSPSKKSLKIIMAKDHYYVSVRDVEKCLRQPKFSAQIVRVKTKPVDDRHVREPMFLVPKHDGVKK